MNSMLCWREDRIRTPPPTASPLTVCPPSSDADIDNSLDGLFVDTIIASRQAKLPGFPSSQQGGSHQRITVIWGLNAAVTHRAAYPIQSRNRCQGWMTWAMAVAIAWNGIGSNCAGGTGNASSSSRSASQSAARTPRLLLSATPRPE
jgi:hypothetical protein